MKAIDYVEGGEDKEVCTCHTLKGTSIDDLRDSGFSLEKLNDTPPQANGTALRVSDEFVQGSQGERESLYSVRG